MDALVCEALGPQDEHQRTRVGEAFSAECARVHCHRSATWVGSLLSSKQCDEDVKKNVEWASDAVCGSRDTMRLEFMTSGLFAYLREHEELQRSRSVF